MPSRYDSHVHTKFLGCGNATMEVPAIVRECERIGVTCLGITDHLNSLDRLPLHMEIRREIENVDADIEVFFGAELNYLGCDQGFPFNEEVKAECGFQFAIGGIHGTYLNEYDLKKMVDIQHRHHLRTCEDPLVDVLVHPYWFGKGEFEANDWPWFDTMKAVPDAYARELGQVAKETGTAIEINATANLANEDYSDSFVREYADYLAVIAEEGASFSPGSDAHDISRLADIRVAWEMIDRLGLGEERIWRPGGRPMAGGAPA